MDRLELARIVMVIEFDTPDRVISFFQSEDVRRGRFGEAVTPDKANPNVRQIIQPDGYRIAAFGRQIQIAYELPNEFREPAIEAMDHAAQRWRRTTSLLSSMKDGKAVWVGIQFFFELSDPSASTLGAAAQNWAEKIGFKVSGDVQLAGLNFQVAVLRESFFESITLQSYETRGGQVVGDTEGLIEVGQFPVLNTGMQFIVDINTKHRNSPERISDTVLNIYERAKSQKDRIIERGVYALLHGGVNG